MTNLLNKTEITKLTTLTNKLIATLDKQSLSALITGWKLGEMLSKGREGMDKKVYKDWYENILEITSVFQAEYIRIFSKFTEVQVNVLGAALGAANVKLLSQNVVTIDDIENLTKYVEGLPEGTKLTRKQCRAKVAAFVKQDKEPTVNPKERVEIIEQSTGSDESSPDSSPSTAPSVFDILTETDTIINNHSREDALALAYAIIEKLK